MCILFIHVDPNPCENNYRLIIASNRDEYYRRPAKELFRSQDGVIGGLDMEPGRENGMWLGLTDSGSKVRFAALLNITGEKREHSKGRGGLVKDYLAQGVSAEQYLKYLESSDTVYSGFNWVGVELDKKESHIYQYGNYPKISSHFMGKHTLAFGNTPLNLPLLKVLKGRNIFREIIKEKLKKEELIDKLKELLRNTENFLPDDELEERVGGVGQFLSSIFVKFPEQGYGTRTHSIILVDYDWNVEFHEFTLKEPIDPENMNWSENSVKSQL